MIRVLLIALATAVLSTSGVAALEAPATDAKVTVLYDHPVPNAPGKSIRGVLVEYAPGGSSPAHTHAKSAFIVATVLNGAIRSQVNDGEARVYRAGEHFTEMPGDRHAVSENASKTEPARLLAVFIVDTNDKVLTTPITK